MEIKRYRTYITLQAEQQMLDIAHYIAVDLQNPDAAIHILDLFDKTIQSLQEFPQRSPLIEEETWRSHDIRRIMVQNYIMYFWINETSDEVQIIAVIYGKRSQRDALASTLRTES